MDNLKGKNMITLSSREKLLYEADMEILKIKSSIREKKFKTIYEDINGIPVDFLNKIDTSISFSELVLGDSKIQEYQEYGLPQNIDFFYDELPDSIRSSKFARMSVSDISKYSKQNEKKRKEVQTFLKLIYEWSFNSNNKGLRFAHHYKKNFEKRIKQGYTEEQIYDWFYNNESKSKAYVFIITAMAIAKFILLLTYTLSSI